VDLAVERVRQIAQGFQVVRQHQVKVTPEDHQLHNIVAAVAVAQERLVRVESLGRQAQVEMVSILILHGRVQLQLVLAVITQVAVERVIQIKVGRQLAARAV
jgi:hypothetical protein